MIGDDPGSERCAGVARDRCDGHASRHELEAVKRIDALFDIERTINGETAERRLAMRQERSAPLVAELEDWMRTERAGLLRHASAAKAHGLYAEALGQLRVLPRRRPNLPYEQRHRESATRYRARTQIVALRRV